MMDFVIQFRFYLASQTPGERGGILSRRRLSQMQVYLSRKVTFYNVNNNFDVFEKNHIHPTVDAAIPHADYLLLSFVEIDAGASRRKARMKNIFEIFRKYAMIILRGLCSAVDGIKLLFENFARL